MQRGSKHHWSKLTEESVIQIQELLTNGEHPKIIAEKYNVSRTSIYEIKAGRSWSHLKY